MLQSHPDRHIDNIGHHGPVVPSGVWGVAFPSTAWTMIEQAKQGNGDSQEEFFRRYATPVYCYIQALCMDRSKAQDITQEIFLKLVEGKLLHHVEPRRYRFRHYLIRTVKNQWFSILRESKAQKRRPVGGIQRLDDILAEAGPYLEPIAHGRPEDAFWRQLAREILNATVRQVKQECESAGLATHFAIFASRHLEHPPATWEAIGLRHQLTGQQAANLAQTVLKRFRKTLIKQLELECENEAEVSQEVQRFIDLFQHQSEDDETEDSHIL